jgi:hypothetical protein
MNCPAPGFDVTFVGEVLEGADSNLSLRQGWNMVGSLVPQEATLATMYATATPGDQVYKFTNNGAGGGSYEYAFFDDIDGVWLPLEFSLIPGDGFWFSAVNAETWVRNFTVPRTP